MQLHEDDRCLLNRIRRRDYQAAVLLYDRYSMAVYSIALRVLRDPTLAEQVVSDIFMEVWRGLKPSMPFAYTRLYPSILLFARNRAVAVLIHKPPPEIELLFDFASGNQQKWDIGREQAGALIEGMPRERRAALERVIFHRVT